MMSIDISYLSPSAQKQILGKLKTDIPKASKYKNKKTTIDKIKFDSKKEARRYPELLCLLKAGVISDLKLQEVFVLQRAYKKSNGESVKAISYKADFTYIKNNKFIVEDVKGVRTDVYKMKKKMMLNVYGIEIKEI